MSETLHNIFGRARNDHPAVDEQATTATATQEAPDTTVIDAEQADDSPAAEDVTEDAGEDTAITEVTDAESTDDADDSDADDSDAYSDDDADGDTDSSADEDAVDEDVEADDDTDEADDSSEILADGEVVAENATPVTVVPVTVETGDTAETDAVETGDTAETSAVESSAVETGAVESGAVEPVAVEPVAAAEVEERAAAGARGTTTVGDAVVSKVVNMVAGKVDGVHRLDDEVGSVAVDAGVVTITIALVVEYGHAVRALAEQLRVDVIDAVEQFLGLDVAAVDVHVTDIHYPESV